MDDTISSFGTFASPIKANSRLNDFKTLCKLGEGSFSTVYKVIRLADNKIYAMKKVLMSRLNDKEKANSLNEIRILASIRSHHIIEYRDSFFDESSDSLCIIMEYAGEGDLLSKLKQYKDINQKLKSESNTEDEDKKDLQNNTQCEEGKNESQISDKNKCISKKLDEKSDSPQKQQKTQQEESIKLPCREVQQEMIYMEEELIWDYFVQCLKGLKCLHDMKILHRDLKCANLFISANNIIKIGDLNVSKVTQRAEQMAKTQTGTPYYTAPEVWKGLTYNHKSDVWSLGCIIYELCCQNHPFRGNTIEGLFTNIMKGKYDRIPQFYSDELAFVISQCLLQNPKLRPSCDQLLRLPDFSPILQKYDEKYKPFLSMHQKQKSHHQNHLQVPGNNNLEFTPQRAQRISSEGHHLIDTINVPSNMKQLSALLPKSNYEETPILLPSVSRFDDNMINIPHNKSNFANRKASMEMISEFDQLEKISSVASSNSSSPQATIRLKQKTSETYAQQNPQSELQIHSTRQDNIFQALLDLQTTDLLHHPITKSLAQQEQVKSIQNTQKQNQKYHNLVAHSPIRLTLQKVHMDNPKSPKQQQQQQYKQQQEEEEQVRSSSDIQIQQKHIFLQKVECREQKNSSYYNQNIDTKNTTAQTNNNKDGSNNKKNSCENSQNKNEVAITSRGSPNQSVIENTSCEQKQSISTQQNNSSSLDPINAYMKKLKMRPHSSALRNSRTVECPVENYTYKIVAAPTLPPQQNLEINQQQTLISEETYPRFAAPNVSYAQITSNAFATQSTNEEDFSFKTKLNGGNGYINDVRNFRIHNNRNGSKDGRVLNRVLQEQVLKTEEDSSSYSPTIFSRGMVAPYSAYDRGQRISTIISQNYQQRLPPSTKQKKSSSPQYKVAQFTQLMKRYLPKAVLKNGIVTISDRNNSQNNATSSQYSHSQGVQQYPNRIPLVYPPAPNSAKYPSHKVATAAVINNSLISQLNNSSYNSNNVSSINGFNSQNYSFNNIQNNYQNTPPYVSYNNENINTVNILNNSFGLNHQKMRLNLSKDNNSAVRAVQYEKNVFQPNTNHIQIVKKFNNAQNIINCHNRLSSPKRQSEQNNRRNIFYHPNNINSFNQYVNTSNVHKVAYNSNHKNISTKLNISDRETNSLETKPIRSIIR